MSAIDLEGLLARARALEPAARYDAALDDLNTVLERAREEGLTAFHASALYYKGRILRIKGELDEAEASGREAAALFGSIGDPIGEAQALLLVGEVFSDQARIGDFDRICRQALGIARRAANASVEARALMLTGTAAVYAGRSEEAAGLIQQATDIYRAAGDRRSLAASLLMLGRVDHMRGRLGEAGVRLRAAIEIFEELGERRAMTGAAFNLGQMHLERDEPEEAQQWAERSLALTEGAGDPVMRLRSLLLLGQIAVERRQFQAALQLLEGAEPLCQQHGLVSILPEVYRVMGEAYLGEGAFQMAEQYALRGRDTVSKDDPYSQGTTTLVLAQAYARQGRPGPARDEFERATALLEQAGETFEIGWGHLAYGEFLATAGADIQARQHLLPARAAFESLGARGKLERIDSLLASLGS